MTRFLYTKIACMLAFIAAVSLGLTALLATPQTTRKELHIVTGFYPTYIAAVNVVGNIDGVSVVNLVDNRAGCLHDYAMKTEDLKTLQAADVLVINGAGAEPFLHPVLQNDPVDTVIDLSSGQLLLESGHVHTHEHAHETVEDNMAVNAHLWVSPARYRLQIEVLRDGLCAADPDNAAAYTNNAAAYIAAIDAVWARLQTAAAPFAQDAHVIVHDSLAYLAEDLQLHVVSALNIGEESTATPDALRAAEDTLLDADSAFFWYDSQYLSEHFHTLEALCPDTTVLSVDTGVAGDGRADSWLTAMTTLCEELEAAA